MKYPFKLKKGVIRSVFSEKLNLKNASIENKEDVFNVICILLFYSNLETYIKPSSCSYNFINSEMSFDLEIQESANKEEFFSSIRIFEELIDINDLVSDKKSKVSS